MPECLFICVERTDAVIHLCFVFFFVALKDDPSRGTRSPALISEVGFVAGLQPTQSTTVCLPAF